ncbi:MAG: DNA primase [Clostridia bacterium]|nr:DNA primase [Clostridia bacterium]
MIPDAIVEEIKYRNSIEDVIGEYVSLKRAGSNFVGLCPFHSEKTPSFTVFTDTKSYYCFGCGSGGDVITFIMKTANLEYPEALEYLARRAGIEIPKTETQKQQGIRRDKILDMNRVAARFFHDNLKNSETALSYCKKRGLSGSVIKHFGIGYAPDSFNALGDFMRKKGFTDEELISGFLCGKSKKTGRAFDYFRGRLIFPIIDSSGDVIAFGGRVLDDSLPKYLNTSDTPAFKKSRSLYAFNFAKAACREALILCEGYMDVVSLHAAGITNAVATLGTALTEEQARLMKRSTDRVIISYDSDEAGQRAANRAFGILREAGVETRVLHMEGAKDPDEFIKKFGVEQFRNILSGSITEFDYKFANILGKYDISTTEGKVKAVNDACKLISSFLSAVERDIYIAKASNALSISKESLKRDVDRSVRKNYYKKKKEFTEDIKRKSEGYGDRVNPDYAKNVKASAAEEAILGMMLDSPEYIRRIKKGEFSLTPNDFHSEFGKAVFEAIIKACDDGKFDISVLNESFDSVQMSRIIKMQIARRGLTNSNKAFEDSIKTLKNSKSKEEMSLTELLNKKRKINKEDI